MSGSESKVPALTHITGNEYEMNWPSVWITTPSGRKYRIEDRGIAGDRIDHSLIAGDPPAKELIKIVEDSDGKGTLEFPSAADQPQ